MLIIPLSRPGFRLGLYLLRTPGAGNYWKFNSSSAPIKPAPVIPRREKEVFMSKFLQKSQESLKKENIQLMKTKNILKLVELKTLIFYICI